MYFFLLTIREYGYESMIPFENGAKGERKFVSTMEFYSYVFQIRSPLSHILLAGRLFQQYIVDNYVKIESERLNWISNNQATIRVDKYNGLWDSFIQGERSGKNVGRYWKKS
jgi:hypothetical protein